MTAAMAKLNSLITLTIFILTLNVVTAYKFYQDEMPNGAGVPHPCKPNYIWQGVGHINTLGGGARNPFGKAFADANKVWTRELCMADSDGDGKTNGDELGDPNCQWQKGQVPDRTSGLFHPGICEPVDSTECKEKNSWDIDCTLGKDFNCSATEEEGVLSYEFRLQNTLVPAKETTYICQSFALPMPDDDLYHMIADEPIIDNYDVMHHTLVYACTGSPEKFTTPVECQMYKPECSRISGWTFGSAGACYRKDIGVAISKSKSDYILMEHHWNNPQKTATYTDSSGMRLFMTKNLRKYESASWAVGQMALNIPPKTKSTVQSGRSGKVEMWRNGRLLRTLVNQESYSYDLPTTYEFDPAVEVIPGDEFRVFCDFDSSTRAEWTHYGDSTAEEMCYGFMDYYPAGHAMEDCADLNDIEFCLLEKNWVSYHEQGVGQKNGCDILSFAFSLNMLNQLKEKVEQFCTSSCDNADCKAAFYSLDEKYKPCLSPEVLPDLSYAMSKDTKIIIRKCTDELFQSTALGLNLISNSVVISTLLLVSLAASL